MANLIKIILLLVFFLATNSYLDVLHKEDLEKGYISNESEVLPAD